MYSSIIVCNTKENFLNKIDLKSYLVTKLTYNFTEKLGSENIVKEGEYFFTANKYDNSISIFDEKTLKEIKNIQIGGEPTDLLLNEDKIYVICSNSNSLIIYDIKEENIIYHIKTGNWPNSITKSDNIIFISNLESNTISILDIVKNEIITNLKVEEYPTKVLVSKNKKMLYICESDLERESNGYIEIIDISTLKSIKKIEVGQYPVDMYEDNNILYVTNFIEGSISIINLKTFAVIANMYLGGNPKSILKENEHLYVTDYIRSKLYIIKKEEIKKIIAIGLEPNAMIFV